jgi:hypothetical protein
MQTTPKLLILALAALHASCGPSGNSPSQTSGPQEANTAVPSSQTPQTSSGAQSQEPVPIAPAHGDNSSKSNSNTGKTQAKLDTSALDARIAKAESKAKAKGATEADKHAAAAAYLERANVYFSAGQPTLYKFALGDFRRVLRYEPDNQEARAKMDIIVSIYHQMGIPVPENGNEP